jgi:acyl carrier protein
MVDGTLATRHVVIAEIRKLLETTGRVPDGLGEDDRFDDLGITSLDLVDIVAALNVKLTVNPFQRSVALTDVRTVADLCRAYQSASSDDAHSASLEELEKSRQRALARRAASQG